MRPLTVEHGEGPERNIILEIFRREQPVLVSFDPAQQQFIFDLLRGSGSLLTPMEAFNQVNGIALAQTGYGLLENDLDIIELVEMIGHVKGFWENPQNHPVEFIRNTPFGIRISLPEGQTDQMTSIENSTQRLIHQESTVQNQTASQVLETITIFYNRELGYPSALTEPTIRRLRHIIRERIAHHPRAENAHWDMVRQPYSNDDPMTVISKRL